MTCRAIMFEAGGATPRRSRQRGAALAVALIALALLSAFGLSLALVINTETRIASNFSAGREVIYAADGALEIAAQELLAVGDWDLLLAGGALSTFVDGAPVGQRQIGDNQFISLTGATDMANSEPRPWGANNPQWRLFAYGRLSPKTYIVVWAGDDPSENDGDASRDGSSDDNPGSGIVALRAEAFGQDGARKVLEATVRRYVGTSGEPALKMLSWQEIR